MVGEEADKRLTEEEEEEAPPTDPPAELGHQLAPEVLHLQHWKDRGCYLQKLWLKLVSPPKQPYSFLYNHHRRSPHPDPA